jgi:hypothetical protein
MGAEKTIETDRNSLCSRCAIFAIASAFVPYSGRVVTSIMNRDSAPLYRVLRRISIKYRLGITEVLLGVNINIAELHLIPLPYTRKKRREYFIKCRDKTEFCRIGMHVKNAVFWDVTPRGSCKNRCFGGT